MNGKQTREHAFHIRVIRAFEEGGWRPVEMRGIPMVEEARCFCCRAGLIPRCVISDRAGTGRIRIGACDFCGYTGYMDRPTEAWMESFYHTQWDRQQERRVEDIKPFGSSIVVDRALTLGVSKDANILEVGTGYGQILRQFSEKGFKRLYGVEHAPQRATVAGRYSGAEVLHGVFGGSDALMRGLRELAPFGLIYAKSVLEHMYDPRLFFRWAADLQQEGGRVMVLVPNVLDEATITTLLFLPHLHGFTAESLKELGERYGYSVLTVDEVGKGLLLVAEKSAAVHARDIASSRMQRGAVEAWQKWDQEFCLDGLMRRSAPALYWSSVDGGRTGFSPRLDGHLAWRAFLAGLEILRRLPLRARAVFLRACFGIARRHRSFVVERAASPGVPHAEHCLYLSMDRLTLWYK